MTPTHIPVLRDRVLEVLAPALAAEGAVCVDATLGLGGHAEALLQAHPGLTLVGLDRDPQALALSTERLAPYAERIHLVRAVYDELPQVLDDLGLAGIDGILFDLGVSSMQLDERERGFSYAHDAPLDMRMDTDSTLTAADVVNTYSVSDLARILRNYGEERFALRVAKAIVRARDQAPLDSTAALAELVRDAIPAATRQTGGHPAKRAFQALRIEVNAELDAVEGAIPAGLDALVVGGRIVVLAYHSLEDKIVKQNIAELAVDRTPADLPVSIAEDGPQFRVLTRGAERASDDEIEANPRAKSARMRAAERIRATTDSRGRDRSTSRRAPHRSTKPRSA